MQGYYQRASDAPICPVCHGRHLPATRGDGRRVHCDGSPAETHAEQNARQRTDRERKQREKEAYAEHKQNCEKWREAKRFERETRDANKRREQIRELCERLERCVLLRAERAAHKDAPPIDAIDLARPFPDVW